MDRFQEMQAFVRIAERQSFTQASDDLQIPRATLTTLIQRLESRLRARLLERTTRTVRVVRSSSRVPTRCSTRLMRLVTVARGMRRSSEACVKLWRSAMRTKACISWKRSMGGLPIYC